MKMGERELTREITFEEAASLDPDEQSGEIVRGKLVHVTRNTWRHGVVAGNVYAALRAYARKTSGWSVAVGDPGAKLGRKPDVLRGPDVAVVRAERKPTGRGADGWLDGAPDVAVEVLGDSQKMSELVEKGLEYLAAGARLVWLLDPDARRVVVLTPPDHVRILGPDGALDGGDELSGFSCEIAELFDE